MSLEATRSSWSKAQGVSSLLLGLCGFQVLITGLILATTAAYSYLYPEEALSKLIGPQRLKLSSLDSWAWVQTAGNYHS